MKDGYIVQPIKSNFNNGSAVFIRNTGTFLLFIIAGHP